MQPGDADSPTYRALNEFVLVIRLFYCRLATLPCKTSNADQLLVAVFSSSQDVCKVFPPDFSRSSLHFCSGKSGFSIIELLVVITILGLLLSIATPAYEKYQDRRDINQAKQDILAIQTALDKFYIENNRFPESLSEIQMDHLQDPWESPYFYLNVSTCDKNSTNAKVRRDKKLKPVNSDYDLYSAGKNKLSKPAFTAAVSHDDIVRCNNGRFIGFASDY